MCDLPGNIPVTISVIIPTYNSEKTLRTCLSSIVNQHYGNKEIIIVDGVSADATMEIVREYASKYSCVRYVSEKDNGIYDAMNKGIRMAGGAWMLFLGADDELYDDNVLLKVSAFLQTTHAKFVYGNAMVAGDTSWAANGDIYDGPFTVKKLFLKNICHQAIFYSTAVFSEVGNYNTSYYVCADWDLNFRCFARLPVAYIDLIIARFRGGGFSTTNTSDSFSRDNLAILKAYFSITYWNALFDGYEWMFFGKAEEAFNKKQMIRAARYLFFSFVHAKKKTTVGTVFLGRVRRWIGI